MEHIEIVEAEAGVGHLADAGHGGGFGLFLGDGDFPELGDLVGDGFEVGYGDLVGEFPLEGFELAPEGATVNPS